MVSFPGKPDANINSDAAEIIRPWTRRHYAVLKAIEATISERVRNFSA